MLCQLINLYLLVVFARILLSWFPIDPGSGMASIFSVVYNVTEPVLGPLRRVMPALGPLDLSPLVVFLGGRIIIQLLAQQGLC